MRLIDADKLKPDFIHGRWESRYVSEQDILDAPTVDAVPVRHGHWVRILNTPTWKCSICGYEITGFIDRDGLTPMDCKVNYCSRCGSRMDEVTE